MAYTAANLNIVSQTLEGTTGTKTWRYTATDSLATVIGAGYVTDATNKGIKAGDVVIYDKTDGPTVYNLKVASISLGAATLAGSDMAASGDIAVGATTADTIGFYGATRTTQPTSASEAAVTVHTITTASTTTSPAGYATTTQANSIAADLAAVVTLANQLRADLVTLGLIKGS